MAPALGRPPAKVGQPAAVLVWLDVRSTGDGGAARGGEVDLLGVETPDSPTVRDEKLHGKDALRLPRSTEDVVAGPVHQQAIE